MIEEGDDPFVFECVVAAFTIINAELVRRDMDFVKFYADVAQWWQKHEEAAKEGFYDSTGGTESRRMFREWLDTYID